MQNSEIYLEGQWVKIVEVFKGIGPENPQLSYRPLKEDTGKEIDQHPISYRKEGLFLFNITFFSSVHF